jgi:hypothetical protein
MHGLIIRMGLISIIRKVYLHHRLEPITHKKYFKPI